MNDQKGQIGVVILLIMSVLLTLGLSTARRASQEAELTSEDEESIRVFSAAESGIERALSELDQAEKSGSTINSEQTYTDNTIGQGKGLSGYTSKLTPRDTVEITWQQNSSIQVPLDSSPSTVDIDWWFNRSTDCANNPAALLITALDQDGTEISARHAYYGDCSDPGETVAGFTSVSAVGGSSYQYQLSLPDASLSLNPGTKTTVALRITPIINDTQIRVSGDLSTESQYSITSSGSDEGNETTRTVVVNRSRSAAPSFMNFSLVSGGMGGGAGNLEVTTN